MSDTKRNPFSAALLKGNETLTIFSGGACLKVWEAHPDLQIAWDWFERGLESADYCKIALAALYDIRTNAKPALVSTFYPNASDARVVGPRSAVEVV